MAKPNNPGGEVEGPSLETYVETRLNLLTATMKNKADAQDAALAAFVDSTKAAMAALKATIDATQLAADIRYQQRFEAQSDALAAAFLSQQTAMQTAFVVAEKAVQAALAAADRAVSKAELAADKRFEGVNEFRGTLSDQQRTLMPREETIVMVRGLTDKLEALKVQTDALFAERLGIKGGYGYAVGVIGFVLVLLSIAIAVMKFGNMGP